MLYRYKIDQLNLFLFKYQIVKVENRIIKFYRINLVNFKYLYRDGKCSVYVYII